MRMIHVFSLQTCQLKLLTNMCCHACLMQCVANTYVATCSTNMCFWAFFQTARSCEQKRMQWFCDTCSVLFVHSYLPKNCWKIRSAIKLKEQALSAWNSTGHGRRMPAGRRLYRCANRWNCPSLSPGSFSTSCWQWRRFQIHHWHTRSLSRIRAGRSSSRFSGFWVAGFKHRGPLTSPRCRRETTWRGWRRVLWRWSHWRATWQSLATSSRPRDPAVQGCCFPPLDLEAAVAKTSKTKAFKVAASVGGPAPPGGADGAPLSDSGGPRSAEPGAATAMTSASTATRIMAKRMAGWLWGPGTGKTSNQQLLWEVTWFIEQLTADRTTVPLSPS